VRVCVVGGGLAGSLLAWRLAQLPGTQVELMTGPGPAADATAASGGAVRAYETLPAQRGLAIASLTELLASPVLREWAQYHETGFAYLRDPADGLAAELAEIEQAVPGSAELMAAAEAFGGRDGPGWTGDETGVVVRERRAGRTSPAALRDAVLADLAARPRATVRPAWLDPAWPDPATSRALRHQDAVVLATGAWTAGLLRASGLPADGYRTRSIQYTIYPAGPARPPAFADERTGLYGLPVADGGLLLGVPTTAWEVAPGPNPVDPAGQERARRLAAGFFPRLTLGPARRQAGAADCYYHPPVLALREIQGQLPRLFTFTGGSGGSAKSALAASQRAAWQLTEVPEHAR
jgi:glycine/D-amino acid oxidase-like deaminating enzyme